MRIKDLKRYPFVPLFALFFGCIALNGSSVEARIAPGSNWQSLKLEHFSIHYPTTYRKMAQVFGFYLEEAHAVLKKSLYWEPPDIIEVVINGDVDSPNGSAAVSPFNRLEIHAVPFSPVGTISEYDNWLRTLAYHELTHIVANDTTRGLFAFGRAIFGSVAKINAYQPSWLIEGLAVYMETLHSQAGRGRSVYLDMLVRTAVMKGLLTGADPKSIHPDLGISLDRLNNGPPIWPGGNTAYHFGYLMNEMLVRWGGPKGPGKISSTSGGRIPYFIDGNAENTVKKNYRTLWADLTKKLKDIVIRDVKRIRREPVTKIKRLSSVGRASGGLTVTEDESKVVFLRDSYSEGPGISTVDIKTGKVSSLGSWSSVSGVTVRSKGKWVVYSRLASHEDYKLFSDVFIRNLQTGREIQLTKGARAFDPDFAPDFSEKNKAVVYVKLGVDGNQALVKWYEGHEEVLYQGKNFERIATPIWGKGFFKNWIVFCLKRNGASEKLFAVHAQSKTYLVLVHLSSRVNRDSGVSASVRTPSWSSSGDLYYTGTQGGVFNIFKIPRSQVQSSLNTGSLAKPVLLTNFETGAVHPFRSKSGRLFAMVYGGRGYDVAEIGELTEGLKGPRLKSQKEKIVSDKVSVAKSSVAKNNVSIDESNPKFEVGEDSNYIVLPAIWPKFWMPFGGAVIDGWMFGVSTAGKDALEIHNYSILAAWDSRATFPVYGLSYSYSGLYPTLSLSRSQSNKYVGLFGVSNQIEQTALTMTYPLLGWQVSFGGSFTTSQFFAQKSTSGGLKAGASYSTMSALPNSIDKLGEDGFYGSGVASGNFIGSEQFTSAEVRLEQRLPSLWDRHFFRFVASGAHATNEKLSALFFLGGGESYITPSSSYLMRGYPQGVVLGRAIATGSVEYWFPLKDLYRGPGTFPFFYQKAKLKLFADIGSGEFVLGQKNRFTTWPIGVGIQLFQDIELFYHFPVTLAMGLSHGLQSRLFGETQFTLGIFAN